MRTRTVLLAAGALGLAGTLAADEPRRSTPPFGTVTAAPPVTPVMSRSATPTKDAVNAAKAKKQEALDASLAKDLGIPVADVKRLHELGYADSEIYTQTQEYHRTPRQMIIEREILGDVARAIAEMSPRVYKLPASEQAAERDRALRDALHAIRRDRRVSKEEMRRVLAGTSYFTAEELRRALGVSLFNTDELKQVMGTRLFGVDRSRDDDVTR